jgi:hypothetical protein
VTPMAPIWGFSSFHHCWTVDRLWVNTRDCGSSDPCDLSASASSELMGTCRTLPRDLDPGCDRTVSAGTSVETSSVARWSASPCLRPDSNSVRKNE